MTIIGCANCGGTHYGSNECPYIEKPCVVCGAGTISACSDCAIDGRLRVHVCNKSECRDAHEKAKHTYRRSESECPHSDIHWHIHHQAFNDNNLHYLEIKGRCKLCDKPLIFRGCPLGMTQKHPTMSLGGEEIRLPFLAEGEEPKGKVIGFVGREVV